MYGEHVLQLSVTPHLAAGRPGRNERGRSVRGDDWGVTRPTPREPKGAWWLRGSGRDGGS